MLMVSGCDRYFQIARCLRDEDLRADRQPEHTQIDLEMSFVTEEEVFTAVEGLMAAIWRACLGVELKLPFPRLTFRDAMLRFGSDKPDLRFGLEFVDTTQIHARSPRNVIAEWAKREDGVGVALTIPGGAEISGTQLRRYEEVVKAAGGGGLSFFKVQTADREKQQVIFPGALLDEFFERTSAQPGDAVVFTNGPWERTCKALGVLRTQLGQAELEKRGLLGKTGNEQEWRFLRERARQGAGHPLRRRVQRHRAGLGIDSHPPHRHPGARDEGDRARARGRLPEVRIPAGGVPVRLAAARRNRNRAGQNRDAPHEEPEPARRDRLPQDRERREPHGWLPRRGRAREPEGARHP
ncbi:MAG: hypothetical protein E6K80_04660, partial [Candidatus Eisenbacteria bacterium]